MRTRTRGWRGGSLGAIAAVTLALGVSGCGGDGSPDPAPTPSPTVTPAPTPTPSAVAPTISATPAAANLTTGQTVAVAVTVAGAAGTPQGTVTLTSGGYTSAAQTLNGGAATITVPAGVLAVGADTLTVRYTPSSASSSAYTAASGTAAVTVTAAAAPSVTAQSTSIAVNGHAFAALPLGSNLVVSVSSNGNVGSQTGFAVYTGTSATQFALKCTQPVAFANNAGSTLAFGAAATPNGSGLAVAVDDAGLALLNRAAVTGACNSAPTVVSQGALSTTQGTFDVTITPDGRYAFVANEYGVVSGGVPGNVGVIALSYDGNGTPTGRLIGQIATGGRAIAGVTLSPDGSRLYVTSEIVAPGSTVSGSGNTILAHAGCQQEGSATTNYGIVSVIDVAKAVAAPNASAIITTIAAGCSPVRIVETANSEVIWVAARGDNRVLAFSTRTLESNPDAALLGYADTGGQAPVGIALFNNDQLLAVANSNRFASPNAVGNLTILNAVPVRPTVVQTVAAGFFPRSVSVAADKTTLYLTNYNSGSVQAISTTTR